MGEWTTTSISHGNMNKIKIIKEISFPHSLGLLYSAFTTYVGLRLTPESINLWLSSIWKTNLCRHNKEKFNTY